MLGTWICSALISGSDSRSQPAHMNLQRAVLPRLCRAPPSSFCSVGCNVYMLSLCCIDSVRGATPSPTEKHEDAWTQGTMALSTESRSIR